ncbi:MAG: acyltransferase [Flavobacteriaceae bacterium]
MVKQRLVDIDVVVGIAIALVVYGHLKYEDIANLTWYSKSRDIVYKFHMPLFMFFSGFLMGISYKPLDNFKSYLKFIKKKANKFIPAFLFFSIVFTALEYIAHRDTIKPLKETVIDILLRPSKSYAGFLWYIYLIFQFYIILPLLSKFVKNYILIMLPLAIFLNFFEFSNLFNFDLFSFYFLFVVLGLYSSQNLTIYYKLVNKIGLIMVIAFLSFIIICFWYNIPKTVFGLVSIPAIHFISIKVGSPFKSVISEIGKYSYYIYLLNSLITGVIFVILKQVLKIEITSLYILILFPLGLFLPLILFKRVIKKTPIINKIIK